MNFTFFQHFSEKSTVPYLFAVSWKITKDNEIKNFEVAILNSEVQ